MWKDYDLDNPSTWTVMESPYLDPAWVERLTAIGGKNLQGDPILRCVWGATHRDEMSSDNGIKYFLCNKPQTLEGFMFHDPVTDMDLMVKTAAEVPVHILVAVPKYSDPIELGERRFIVERYRDAEFLARSSRYTESSVIDRDEVLEFPFCRNCHEELSTNADGEPQPCLNCGSKRHYLRTERIEGDGQLLKADQSKGCYDFFCRLENQLGEPMEADALALRNIEQLWQMTQKAEKDKIRDMLVSTEPQRAVNERATSPVNPFAPPPV